ncbi:hypothetical protein SDC9_41110 [bioreactor metagenome]|uniref:Uncharacterized protein n=1 Tax=bioreactor metagenome TaxID=1076179 RepID=A0A644VUJ3_9ZZZZ
MAPGSAEDGGQRAIDGIGDRVDVIGRRDQRRAEAQRVVEAGERAVRHAEHHAALRPLGHHAGNLGLGHRLFRRPVGDQLGAREQARAAHIADHLVLFHQRIEVRHDPLAHGDGVLKQPLVLDDAHVLERRRRARGAASEGRDVAEIAQLVRGVLELLEHRLGGHAARDRRIARGHALRHRHEVWLDAVVLVAEPGAGASHAADDLVDVQQDVVFLADLLYPLPIALRRHDHATARGDGLEAEQAHGVRALAQDHFLDRIRRPLAIVLDIPLRAVFKAMRHCDEALREGAVLQRALFLATGGERADRRAVIVALAIEDLRLLAAMQPRRDLAHHLEDLLVRFRARVRVIDPAQPRHLGQQPLREQRARNGAAAARPIGQLDQLVADRVRDALAAIADVHRPDPARDRVDEFGAVLVPDPQALALDDDARVGGLERLVLQQVVPDVGAVGLGDVGKVVGELVHGTRSVRSGERCLPARKPLSGACNNPFSVAAKSLILRI